MKRFPATFSTSWQVSRALYSLAVWSGGRRTNIWIPQFASLRNHVREISRTPAGSRVERLSRVLSMWPDIAEVSASLPCDGAAELFAACLEEAPALLELGYPSGEGLDFVTRLPSPGANTRRTPAQMRASIHHLGGDFAHLLTLMRVPDPFTPSLRVMFSVWPRFMPAGEYEGLLLSWPGARLPATIFSRTELRGYCLLTLYDLAQRLRASAGVLPTQASFQAFASEP
jgi:hypothetical protein